MRAVLSPVWAEAGSGDPMQHAAFVPRGGWIDDDAASTLAPSEWSEAPSDFMYETASEGELDYVLLSLSMS